MKLIKSIFNSDVYGVEYNSDWKNLPLHRKKVMGVVFDQDNKVALNLYPDCINFPGDEFGFPGGGVDEDEDILSAFKREILEEVGVKVKDITPVGRIDEYREERGGRQEVYCYLAKVEGEKGEPQLTEREIEDGLLISWKSIDEAKDLIIDKKKCFSRETDLVLLDYLEEEGLV